MKDRYRGLKALALVLIGLLGVHAFHRLEIRSGLEMLTGDSGDNRLVLFLLEHSWRAIQGKAAFLSPQIFHPVQGTLGYSEALWGFAPTYWGLRALKLDPYTATALNFILLDFLAYLATVWLLLQGLRTGVMAAALGALLFVFNSAKFNQLMHLQLQPLVYPPLILLCLIEAGKRAEGISGWKVFALLSTAGLLIDLQLVSSIYAGWFLCFWLLLFVIFATRFATARTLLSNLLSRHKWPLRGAALVFALGLIPFVRIYGPVVLEMGTRSYPEARSMLLDLPSLAWMGHENRMWGWLNRATPVFQAIPLEWEHRVGLGAVTTLAWITVSALTLPLIRRKRQEHLPRWLLEACGQNDLWVAIFVSTVAAVGAFYLLAFKFYGGLSLWALVFHLVPGASGVRAVARGVILLWLPISMVLAVLLDWTLKRQGRLGWKALALILGCLALAEQAGVNGGFSTSEDRARVERVIRAIPQNCAAFFVRTDSLNTRPDWEIQLDAMLASVFTGIPTLNGYSGQTPKDWPLENPRNSFSRQAASQWLRAHSIPEAPCEVFFR